jgi:hypothetical protein
MRKTARVNGHELSLASRADTELDILMGLEPGDMIYLVEKGGDEFLLLFNLYEPVNKFDEHVVLASNQDLAGIRLSPIWENVRSWKPVVVRDLPLYVRLPYKGSGFSDLLREAA